MLKTIAKDVPKWKKILFLVVFALVMARIAYIGVRHEIDKEYRTSFAYDLSQAEEIPCENLSVIFSSDKKSLTA